jgi:biotin synthase-related radical SAM superfamily protein
MVPVDGLFDLLRLKELGLHELSINIELFNAAVAADLMPQKARQGLIGYLNFITEATDVLGPRRVRSMMMVGLEPPGETLAGVRAILQAGGVPVLSPFRPDPATPLRDVAPLSGEEYEEIFLRATELATKAGAELGPSCPPCTHNTLTLVGTDRGEVQYLYPLPGLV